MAGTNKIRSIAVTTLKFGVAFGLIGWMVAQEKLDLSQLAIVVTRFDVLALVVITWFAVPVGMGTIRWLLLLRGMGISVLPKRALQLQSIGLFFNSAMPGGAVGGDIIKALYVMREQGSSRRTPAMLTILLDRVVGLFGLFTVGIVSVSLHFNEYMATPALRPVVFGVYGCFLAMILFFGAVFVKYPNDRDPFRWLLMRRLPGFTTLAKVYEATRQYRKNPRYLLGAWGVSIAIQAWSLGLFLYLARAILGPGADVSAIAGIFPIGICVTVIPITPGGLGVGHVAFKELFELVGLSQGADVFNVFAVSALAMNLLGAVPYLFTRAQIDKLVDDAQKNPPVGSSDHAFRRSSS